MSFAKIGSSLGQSVNTTNAITTGFDSSGADLLVYCECVLTGVTITRTDIKGNTPVSAVAHDNTVSKQNILYSVGTGGLPPVVGLNHTYQISHASTANFPSCWMGAYSGANTAPLDIATGNGGSGTVPNLDAAAGNQTPSEGNELLVFSAGDAWDAVDTVSVGTIDAQGGLVGGTAFALCVATEIQTSATARNPQFAWSPNARGNAAIASFKKAAAATTDAAGSASGSGTATGVGAATAASPGSSAGTGTASGVGASIAAAVGSAAGTSTAAASSNPGDAIGDAAGTSAVSGVGRSVASAVGASSGAATGAATSAANAPGAPTDALIVVAGNLRARVSATAPVDMGSSAVDLYRVTSSHGETQTGATLPIDITVANVAQTFTVAAHNSYGWSDESDASASVTPGVGCAEFDGAGNNYLKRDALVSQGSFPCWEAIYISQYERSVSGTTYCATAHERPSGTMNGTALTIGALRPKGVIGNGTALSTATAVQCNIENPYWDCLLWVKRSATDCELFINNVSQGVVNLNKTMNLSAGSPESRIGRRVNGTAGYRGRLANFVCGTGEPTAAGRVTLNTFGADYSTVECTGGAVTNWIPLSTNAKDLVGTEDFTEVGTMDYNADTVADRALPTVAEICQWIFGQPTLPSAQPNSVTTGSLSDPIDTTGWSNLASVQNVDISFTDAGGGTWTTRCFYYRCTTPIIPGRHAVMCDNGHDSAAQWADYNFPALIQELIETGYDAMITLTPGFGTTDPHFGIYSSHDHYWDDFVVGGFNPMEHWMRPSAICANYLESRADLISMCGLSGGGTRAAHYPAMDPRVTRSICCRGVTADRVAHLDDGGIDFEQRTLPNGWRTEHYFERNVIPNRLFWVIHHPADTCCFSATVYGSASAYDASFLAPIRARNSLGKLAIKIDTGISAHSWTSSGIGFVMEALATPLRVGGGARRLGLGIGIGL